jgi:hypothetical protein
LIDRKAAHPYIDRIMNSPISNVRRRRAAFAAGTDVLV